MNVVFAGDLDLAGGARLLEAVAGLVAGSCGPFPVEVDLGGVTFVDCAGFRALDHALSHVVAAGGDVTAARVSPVFDRTARIVAKLPGVAGPACSLWSELVRPVDGGWAPGEVGLQRDPSPRIDVGGAPPAGRRVVQPTWLIR